MEETKEYLQQLAPTKKLICYLNDTLKTCTSESEKQQIKHIVSESEQLVKEIYDFVFQLSTPLALVINLRYLEGLSVYEVCKELYISKSTYYTLHDLAIEKLTEMRNKK